MEGRQQIDVLQGNAAETLIVSINARNKSLPELNLPSFQHRHRISPGGLDLLDLHIGIPPSVTVQERRLHAFDMLRRGADREHAGVAPLQ